ncbi:MAG: hypothetical protein IFK94_10255 [Acidobacteria bacterium]|uniref:Uncharacterized protein n=1 Tax=Candidatus Polarisedimenticola svalbardensis TaxID=2886004 RepID=A0A8J6XV29_9BACT|nr:hypothetical protein [Candidatus Polarisedimenticola svalbardensis]
MKQQIPILAATVLLLAGWEFSPAHRIITTEHPDGLIDSKAIPIKSADRVIIRFHVVDGKGVVE